MDWRSVFKRRYVVCCILLFPGNVKVESKIMITSQHTDGILFLRGNKVKKGISIFANLNV